MTKTTSVHILQIGPARFRELVDHQLTVLHHNLMTICSDQSDGFGVMALRKSTALAARRTVSMLAALTLMAAAPALATQAVKTTKLTDSRLVLATLKGNVQLYGSRFGDQAFQAGVLALLKARKIQVTVLTSQAAVKSMAPLKAAGAKVYYLPTGINMTGSLVLSGNDTVLMNKDGRTWYVMQGPGLAVQAKTQMIPYAPYAKAF